LFLRALVLASCCSLSREAGLFLRVHNYRSAQPRELTGRRRRPGAQADVARAQHRPMTFAAASDLYG
jgi:hypothetical protein